ncbi:hypothetical protein CC80DRAFT_285890 [Byssothecium circinans]|uniref:Nucleoporin Nup133/Nup155-like C-terminal domain-containing protein n=1 Tax=Byssothecium circinans TaxID=147558 RepID=A0A6A5U8G1_9PLEO|nr:hypothetical protein CC80DRAFT_285890 [Byssothecium circinans]
MFSVEGSSGSARSSLRNTRRRPRNSDGPQQGRRKRSKLGDDTFVAVSEAQANGNGSLVMNGHVTGGVEGSLVLVDMPVREKKDQPKRVLKEDAAVCLNRCKQYIVRKLPSFPAQLSSGSTPFRASAIPSAGLALALTTDSALVWDYNGASGATKVLALSLPPSLKAADPLPLGAIVRNGPADDFGVVAVAPATGKIVFWENVDSAEARGHFAQRHQGVEGSIKLYSGERITDLVDIEHAGYILVLSSGRLAQMTLRDSQGRPSIVTTVMSAPNGSGGSFFSFKGLLGGAIRKTIASVQARPSESKGQMEVITATKNGLFQLWDLNWSGQQIFKREVDAYRDMLAAIQQGSAPEMRTQQEIHILDFSIMDQQHPDRRLSLLTLVALSGRNMMDYFLLELDLSETTATVSRAIPLRNFHQMELPKEPTGTLLLPKPGHTAFVQFPTAIVVASLAEPEESPEAQLVADSGSTLLPFQDTIYFRSDANVRITGHGLEHASRKGKQPSVLIFIEDYGTLEISTIASRAADAEIQHKVTAFDKIVSATFYSTVPGTILSFSTKSRFDFSLAEVEQAALSISGGILASDFQHVSQATYSIEELLRKRAKALYTLNAHLRSQYSQLSFAARWRLLWQAEKVAAATQLWKWYQTKLRDQELHPEAYPEKVLMSDIVKALRDKFKSQPDESEPDRVRQFFLKNIDNIGVLVPMGWHHLRVCYIDSASKEGPAIMQRLSEANDVICLTLETAFSFRQANIERYGLDPTSLGDGILKMGLGYDMLPSFWTSSHNMVSSIRSLIDVGRNVAEDSFENYVQEDLSKKIAKDNPRLVRMGCQTHIERFRWALEQSDEKTREMGRNLRDEWDLNVRPAQIYGLMNIGLASDGMNLAEKYRDMPTLVNLICDETDWLESSKEASQSKIEQAEIGVKLNRIKERITNYFNDYQEEFAEAYFNKHIADGRSLQLFDNDGLFDEKILSYYLMRDSSRSKLYWIDRVGHNDFTSAGLALAKAAKRHETNSWCNRVELSLSKLALMCKDQVEPTTSEQQGGPVEKPKRPMKEITARKVLGVTLKVDILLEVGKIRELVYEHLLPTVTRALDDKAAVDLLVDEYGQERLKERPALQALLRQGLDDWVHHRVVKPGLMIDVLTLMVSEDNSHQGDPISSNEFVYAFKTLALGWEEVGRASRLGLKGIIWKRLFIQDDWEEINKTNEVSDTTLNEFLLTRTLLGWTVRQLYELTKKDKRYAQVWFRDFEELRDRGCTAGDLCTRFDNPDLIEPIVAENELDQRVFYKYWAECNLPKWLNACVRAAKWSLYGGVDDAAVQQEEPAANGAVVGDDEVVHQSVEVEEHPIPNEEPYEGDEDDAEGGDVEMTD